MQTEYRQLKSLQSRMLTDVIYVLCGRHDVEDAEAVLRLTCWLAWFVWMVMK